MSATAIINEPDVNGERDILIVSADLLGIFVTYLVYLYIFQEFNRIHHCI